MSGGGSPWPPGRPGGMGGPWPGPGRFGIAGAGRPVAGGGGGARLPPICPAMPIPPMLAPVIGTPLLGPPGDGGDNLHIVLAVSDTSES